MKNSVLVIAVVMVIGAAAMTARAQSSMNTVTYQGVLTQNGAPVPDGTHTLTFKIYDAASGGAVVETVSVPGVTTTQGRFAAAVPVSPASFNGQDRWWSVTFNSVELPPQKVTAVPYAVTARGLGVSASGDLGIGTALPKAGLHIVRGAVPQMLVESSSSGGTVNYTGLRHNDLVFGNYRLPSGESQCFLSNGYANNAAGVPAYSPRRISFGTATSDDFSVASFDPVLTIMCNASKSVGIGTASPGATLDVVGTTRTSVLVITGADLAENFDVRAGPTGGSASAGAATQPRAGLVVSIDPGNPGKLIVAAEAYDKKVAGVISGANGLDVGVVLGKDNKSPFIDGEHPVAMTGRVWVFADESAGKIEPGDRLTSSGARPGYAMKVTDEALAPGAVIGKAMTGVDERSGMVLVLVNLQ